MASQQQRTGALLVNLGTPDSPTTGDVRRYLREFLSDPRVIDINPVGRWLLLNLIILPTRPSKSAEAYRSVWTEQGSPLLVYGESLRDRVREEMGDDWVVELGMRYGRPSLQDAIDRLLEADVDRIVVLPLFPQYSSAATGSALEKVHEIVRGKWNVPPVETINEFFDHPGFIQSFTDVARPQLDSFKQDFVLFSYHGLPERHLEKSDPTGRHCLNIPQCCDRIVKANRYCYRAQCIHTTKALVKSLGLAEGRYESTFQSRLGNTPWIKPYTDEYLSVLAEQGVKRLAVMCPAFTADCLETIEEIGMQAKEDWEALGGESLLLVPSLNDHPSWVRAVVGMLRDKAGSPLVQLPVRSAVSA